MRTLPVTLVNVKRSESSLDRFRWADVDGVPTVLPLPL